MFKSSLIVILIILLSVSVQAVKIEGKILSEYVYTTGEQMNQLGVVEEINDTDNKSELYLGFSGFIKDYRYKLDLLVEGDEVEIEVERASISTFIGPAFLEVGKKEWIWSKGFSFFPTYPFPEDQKNLGIETNLFYNGYDFDIGVIMNEDNDYLSSGWFRSGSAFESSDYQVVFSYLKNDEDVELNNNMGRKHGINLGIDYSKDFLNDIVLHFGGNLRYWLEDDEKEEEYLLGLSYYTQNNMLLIGEYYREVDEFLVLSLTNIDILADWEWNLNYLINLKDFGQRRGFGISYSGFDMISPEVELINYGGPNDSILDMNPIDWEFKFKLEIEFFSG